MSSKPYILYENVQVRYSAFSHGLKDFNLQIQKGEFIFLVGRTGAGKSTAIKLLTREICHDSGKVIFDGTDLSLFDDRDLPSLRQRLGIVPQDFALLPRKKVWENVAYAMRACGHTQREVMRKVPEILESVDLGRRADAYPHELSGGEQQRVAIGRALINNPPLILADEPTGNLDPELSWGIISLLKSLNDRGTTVIVASHDTQVVKKLNTRTITLEGGMIIGDSSIEPEVLHRPNFAVINPFEPASSVNEPIRLSQIPKWAVSGNLPRVDMTLPSPRGRAHIENVEFTEVHDA